MLSFVKTDPNILPKHDYCQQIVLCFVFDVFWPIFDPYLRNLNFCIISRPGFDPYSKKRVGVALAFPLRPQQWMVNLSTYGKRAP